MCFDLLRRWYFNKELKEIKILEKKVFKGVVFKLEDSLSNGFKVRKWLVFSINFKEVIMIKRE